MGHLLKDFSVSPRTGFLPELHPITSLAHVDDNFAKLEDFASNITRLIYTKQVRAHIRTASEGDERSLFPTHLDISKLENKLEHERAMLLLSIIGHVYLHGNANLSEEPLDIVPFALSTPWTQVADILGRPPVLSHASVALQNWKLIDQSRDIVLDNIILLNNIVGGYDEDWFFTVTIAIEACGVPGIFAAAEICDLLNNDAANEETIILHLNNIILALGNMHTTLKQMKTQCNPYVFYHRIRIYLNGWSHGSSTHPNGVIYKGWRNEQRHKFHGGSAGQSTLLQCFDELLGVKHTSDMLIQFRQYMPPEHQRFLKWLNESKSLRQYVTERRANQELLGAFNNTMKAVNSLRELHIGIVHQYIMQQTKDSNGEKGTGGSSPVQFLSSVKRAGEYIE
jgi:indoleamine 2,3-dioxygenase